MQDRAQLDDATSSHPLHLQKNPILQIPTEQSNIYIKREVIRELSGLGRNTDWILRLLVALSSPILTRHQVGMKKIHIDNALISVIMGESG